MGSSSPAHSSGIIASNSGMFSAQRLPSAVRGECSLHVVMLRPGESLLQVVMDWFLEALSCANMSRKIRRHGCNACMQGQDLEVGLPDEYLSERTAWGCLCYGVSYVAESHGSTYLLAIARSLSPHYILLHILLCCYRRCAPQLHRRLRIWRT